ncbi:DUF29 domain-containing protein [Pannus brasiliensis CCIBt3594]|uniref:DUF29 domain-containing protein n=1 Tax=Pannus brasiliensis CCIBt3594 TaxID=1427578 RepID=A0AAW9QPE7_9CHRO
MTNQSLYDRDFNLWIEKNVSLLEKRQFSDLDIENLIEEIGSIGKSDRRSLESYSLKLFERLLKLQYWKFELAYNERGWRNEVRNCRRSIKRLLADSPSLKSYLIEIFDNCFQEARISLS